jgi:hypothetical protein
VNCLPRSRDSVIRKPRVVVFPAWKPSCRFCPLLSTLRGEALRRGIDRSFARSVCTKTLRTQLRRAPRSGRTRVRRGVHAGSERCQEPRRDRPYAWVAFGVGKSDRFPCLLLCSGSSNPASPVSQRVQHSQYLLRCSRLAQEGVGASRQGGLLRLHLLAKHDDAARKPKLSQIRQQRRP